MRILFVVQRYGREVAGGAEAHCREFATRLAARGHEVEVLTTCALNYEDWSDHFEAGTSGLDGVAVHRLPVAQPRDREVFGRWDQRMAWGHRRPPLHLQEGWMHEQGPVLDGLVPWIETRASGYDVVVFFTYLYWSTWAGLPAAAGRVPTVLHPTAHDEPPFWLSIFDTTFRMAHAFAFSTVEEGELVRGRVGALRPSRIVGVGVDLDVPGEADPAVFRAAYGLGERPYLAFVGRVVAGKGAAELFDWFTTYKERRPDADLALVFVGDPLMPLPEHPDVVVTGFVDDLMRHHALAGMLALAQPSYFESFSMVLTEAWAHNRPALVQGRCEVLVGQARRSGGAIPYKGYAEFEAAVDLLFDDPSLADELGAAGRHYVEANYAWEVVMDRYEGLLEGVVARGMSSASLMS